MSCSPLRQVPLMNGKLVAPLECEVLRDTRNHFPFREVGLAFFHIHSSKWKSFIGPYPLAFPLSVPLVKEKRDQKGEPSQSRAITKCEKKRNKSSLLHRRRMSNWKRVLSKWKGDAGQSRACRTHGSGQVDCKCQGVQGIKHRMSLSQTASK